VKRRLLILVLALVASFGGAPAVAHADGGQNDAVAINTKDGSSLFKFAFAVRHVLNGVVDQENGAAAYAQCESCQTTAIAIEIVLVEAPASTVTPTNVAVAINQNCTLCDTFATAYEFVIGTNGPVHFTHEGIQALHDIRKEIQSWGKQGLSNTEIRARLPDVIARLEDVLATQLVGDGKAAPHQGDETDTDESQTTPQATPTAPTSSTETGTVNTTTTVPTDTTDTSQTTQTTPTTTTEPTTTDTTTTTP
jgi:putative peptide zinc metalloprotease protein